MEELLRAMDAAAAIVTYVRAKAMEGIYAGDADRREAHREKMVEIGDVARRAAGRRVTLQDALRVNGIQGRVLTEEAAEELWRQGRLGRLAMECKSGVRAVARLTLLREIRLPGMHATTAASVRDLLLQEERTGREEKEQTGKRSRNTAEGGRQEKQRRREGGCEHAAVCTGSTSAAAAGAGADLHAVAQQVVAMQQQQQERAGQQPQRMRQIVAEMRAEGAEAERERDSSTEERVGAAPSREQHTHAQASSSSADRADATTEENS